MNLVTLRTYSDRVEANLHLTLLENNGIEAIIENDQEVLINPGILSGAGIIIKVLEEDYEKALKIIENG
ncbi:MAG TPA: DUF2007 domain-containing protein [Saprospiraceae bacterium]|nr:DUF2007 domain-containing protein [Saprospiraceae bacterium]